MLAFAMDLSNGGQLISYSESMIVVSDGAG